MWIRRHPVRAAIYAALLAAIVLVALRPVPVALWAVNGPAGRAFARHLGVSFRAAEMSGSLSRVEIVRLQAEVTAESPVRFATGRLGIEGLRSVHTSGIKLGETTTVEECDIDLQERVAHAKGIHFAQAVKIAEAKAAFAPARVDALGISGFGAQLDSASAGPVALEQDRVHVALAEIKGARISAVRDASGRWNLQAAETLATAARKAGLEVAAVRAAYPRLLARLHSLLRWMIVCLAVAIAAAKFLLTCGRAPLRAVSAVAALVAPFLTPWFGIYVSLAAVVAAALALLAFLYRKAPEWHQRAEPVAADLAGPPVLTLLLAAYLHAYPALPAMPRTLHVDRALASGISATVNDGRNLIEVAAPQVAAGDIQAAETTQVSSLAASGLAITGDGWRVDLPEVTASGVSLSETAVSVKKVSFQGAAESDFARTRLARYNYLPDGLKRRVQLGFTGSATASSPPLRFSAESSIRGEGIDLSLRADGDSGSVRVAGIRAGGPSDLRIADGSALVALAPKIAATLHLAGVGLRQFAAATVDVSMNQGRGEARIRGAEFPLARIDELLASGTFARDRLAVDASARNLAFRSSGDAIIGDVPRIDGRLSGTWHSEVLEGEVGISSSRFELDHPMRFSADLLNGSLRVPAQGFIVSQTVVPRAPEKIQTEVGLAASLQKGGPSAQARIRIPSFRPEVQPFALEINDIDVSAEFEQGKARINIGTGWNRIEYPSLPRPNRLESIDRLQLALDVEGDVLHPSLTEGWRVPEIPRLPERFQVAGVWPGLRVVTDKDERLSLDGLTVALNRLTMPRSRIQSIELGLGLRAFGGRSLDLISRLALSDELANIKIGGSFAWAPSFEATASPGRLNVSLPRLIPDFPGFKGSISGIRADVRYAPGLIAEVSGSLTLDSGPLLDLKIDDAPVTSAQAQLGSPAQVEFSLTQAGAAAAISAPSFGVSVEAREAGHISAGGSIETNARLIRDDDPAPVLDTLRHAASLATPHFKRAREFLGAPAATGWRIQARHASTTPFLRVDRDRLELSGSFAAGSLKTGAVAADIVERHGNLLVDASVPVEMEGSETQLVVPVQLAIGEAFPKSDATSGLLWDAAAVEKIWAGFSPRHASGGALIDRPSFEFGPASLLQLAVPSQPVRAVVGLGDLLQVHVPVTARLLFGSVMTTTQAEVSWNGSTPSVRARLEGGFRNVQAGAIGLAVSGVHQPVVEDSLDGSLRFSLNDLAVTRESLDHWLAHPASFDRFDRFDLSFQAVRSKDQAGPGILQVAFDTRVRLMNQVLQQIVNELRFLVPPQLVTYDGLRASFEVTGGVLQTKNPLLELSGVKILSTELLDLIANVRVRLGNRLSDEMPLSDLIRYALGGTR